MQQVQVKKLTPLNWKIFKEIRLEALKAHPSFFCPSRDEFAFSQLDWQERLNNPNGANFGVFDGNQIIGICGVIRENNLAHTLRAHLVGSYLRKAYRGRGLSKTMYQARIDWARAEGMQTLCVEHHENNRASFQAHQKFAFKKVRAWERVWPSGEHALAVRYELSLE